MCPFSSGHGPYHGWKRLFSWIPALHLQQRQRARNHSCGDVSSARWEPSFHFSPATDLLACYLSKLWPWGSALFHRHCVCKMWMAAFLADCGWLLGILEVELWVSSGEYHCIVLKERSCGIQGQLKQLIGSGLVYFKFCSHLSTHLGNLFVSQKQQQLVFLFLMC